MSISAEDLDAIGSRVESVLREIAVPKPSRISEHYAALTLAIVLLREQVLGDLTPTDRRIVVEREVGQLLKKRSALEDNLDPGLPAEALAEAGGS